jgi:hypothetical protein
VRAALRQAIASLLIAAPILVAGCGESGHENLAPRDSATSPTTFGGDETPLSAAVKEWRVAQESGTDAVHWRIETGDVSSTRCLRAAITPPPGPTVKELTGEIGADLPSDEGVLADDPSENGPCAPIPSLTDGTSQPLYSLLIHQPKAKSAYNYIVGTVDEAITDVRVEYDDDTFGSASVAGGTFVVVYGSTRRVTALHPIVAKFPNLTCHVMYVDFPGSGDPYQLFFWDDGGCEGYTFPMPRS